jgi:hypothetical protein
MRRMCVLSSMTRKRSRLKIDADHQSMIPKSMPSGFDPVGGNRFSDKIMLKSEIQT